MSSRDSKTRPPLTPSPSLEDWRPRKIGPYTILEVLGEGGMGTVYLAEQLAPIRRLAALKLIKLGQDTKEVLARFDQERQALSLMNHPNIAKVFDAGAAEDGRPYFVMEYVEGPRISDYCDTAKLSIPARLQLFLDVCAGIQHAHQKGIIHRDLKPSNILVATSDDGAPIPKIIDFGLAQATEQRLTDQTLFTRQGQWIGTPEYMSPEQAGRGAHAVDTRSDIYSLGALLYELMTGHLPFDSMSLREAGLLEIQRAIQEIEPPKPSTRITSASDHDHWLAECRCIDAVSLRKRLRGDLDWIIMRALEKEPARRYASAGEFAADIERHLEHKPALAGPPSWTYRTQKFLRRYRMQVGAASAVLIALIVGLAIAIRQYGFAEENRLRAEVSASNAKKQELLAREQEAVAAEAARIARLRSEEAENSARAAYAASTRANESLQRFNLLANVARFEKLLEEEQDLWPAWPQNLAAFRAWNLEFNRIASERQSIIAAIRDIDARSSEAYRRYGDSLRELQAKYQRVANPDRESVLLNIRSMIGTLRQSQEQAWYETLEMLRTDEFLRETLQRLLVDIDREHGRARERMRERLRWARTIEQRSIGAFEAEWRDAALRVGRARHYRGFSLRPQIGLVPLGRNATTQLEEFLHLASHRRNLEVPQRRPDGALDLRPGHGIIFVLLPPRVTSDQRLEPPIFVGKHEVTQAQWQRLTGEAPSAFHDEGEDLGDATSQHPVENVNHDEGARFMARHGLRLPREAEWQHMLTGRVGRRSMASRWQESTSDCNFFGDDSWPSTAPVASTPGNQAGLHDLLGNVAEWCAANAPDAKRASAWGGSWGDPRPTGDAIPQRLEARERRSDRIGVRAVRDLIAD